MHPFSDATATPHPREWRRAEEKGPEWLHYCMRPNIHPRCPTQSNAVQRSSTQFNGQHVIPSHKASVAALGWRRSLRISWAEILGRPYDSGTTASQTVKQPQPASVPFGNTRTTTCPAVDSLSASASTSALGYKTSPPLTAAVILSFC